MGGHIQSASSVHWGTPAHVLERVRLFFGEIDLDPCASAESQKLVRAKEAWQPPVCDGLDDPWGDRRVFVNPPFGRTWLFKDGRCLTGSELDALAEAQARANRLHEWETSAERKKGIAARRKVIVATDVKRTQTIADWATKCMIAHRVGGAEVILLLPAAVDTEHWQKTVWRTAAALCFPAGRLEYVGSSKGPSPMASALAYWGPRAAQFGSEFSSLGWCMAGMLGWGRDDARGVAADPRLRVPPPQGENLAVSVPGAAEAPAGGGAPGGAAAAASPGDAAGPLLPQR